MLLCRDMLYDRHVPNAFPAFEKLAMHEKVTKEAARLTKNKIQCSMMILNFAMA